MNVSERSIKSDLERVDRMSDSEIDYSEIPPLDSSFFTRATADWPPAKQQLTIRLDADVLKWLKSNGRGYQTRINRVLRAAMEDHTSRPKGDLPTRSLCVNSARLLLDNTQSSFPQH